MVFIRSVSQQTQATASTEQAVDSSHRVLNQASSFPSRPLRKTQAQNFGVGHAVSRRNAENLFSQPLVGQKRLRSEVGVNSSSPLNSDKGGSRMHRSASFQERLLSLRNGVTLVYDRRHTSVKNTRLRSTSDLSSLPPEVKQEGLLNLKLSGSAAITKLMLTEIKAMVGDHHQILICDLRREPHAVANDHSVTWTIPNNWLNIDRPLHEAIQDEDAKIQELRSVKPEKLIAVLHKDYKKELRRPEQKALLDPILHSEKELVESHGMQYVRFGVSDHLRPNDGEVDRFVEVMRKIPQDTWVHMHCKGGQGRTTTFMVLYDILRNGDQVSLRDIVERQKHLGFDYDVSSDGPKVERKQFRHERWQFIQAFYEFAKTKPLESTHSWSEWNAVHDARG
jgi:protein tyrosine phosphatase (PTP) superfamily phosphohydrolase (DUF442 family)